MRNATISLLLGLFFSCGAWSEEPPMMRRPLLEPADVVAQLHKAAADNAWPRGMVVRLEAAMSGSKQRDGDWEQELREIWEFSGEQVHRVTIVHPPGDSGSRLYRRVQSLPMDCRKFIRPLRDAELDRLADGEGEGDLLLFAGTDFAVGHRSLVVLIDGQPVVELIECCAFASMAESDALKFADLYEKLAVPARDAFLP